MRLILRSLPILVLAAALFSACTIGKITPTVITQATSQSTSLPTPQIYGSPTVTPQMSQHLLLSTWENPGRISAYVLILSNGRSALLMAIGQNCNC